MAQRGFNQYVYMKKYPELLRLRWIRPELFKLKTGNRKPYVLKADGRKCFGCGKELLRGRTTYHGGKAAPDFCSVNCPPKPHVKPIRLNNIFLASIYASEHKHGVEPQNASITSDERRKNMRALNIVLREISRDVSLDAVTREDISYASDFLLKAIRLSKEEPEERREITPRHGKFLALKLIYVHLRALIADDDVNWRVKKDVHRSLYFVNESIRGMLGKNIRRTAKEKNRYLKGDVA